MPKFIAGLELSRRFYQEAVQPLLHQHFPVLPHAATLIGSGSEVLGYDTPMSLDHYWGPRVYLFLDEGDLAQADRILEVMSHHLPPTIAGYPVHFGDSSGEAGMDVMTFKSEPPFKHHVFVHSVRSFVWDHLHWDDTQPWDAVDWLTVSSQTLLELTAGAVFHDDIGELTRLREQFQWYPADVWRYLMACGWQRIGQEEHLMPRAGYAGDELGSALIGSRLMRDVMTLCFLIEQRYAPYPKWFGTAFQRLPCAVEMTPHLLAAQRAPSWPEREAALGKAYGLLVKLQNRLGITDLFPEHTSAFFDRPFQVIHGSDIAQAIKRTIQDHQVQQIADRTLIGSIDQFSDSADFRGSVDARIQYRSLYLDGG
jgi:hypothetical protein